MPREEFHNNTEVQQEEGVRNSCLNVLFSEAGRKRMIGLTITISVLNPVSS